MKKLTLSKAKKISKFIAKYMFLDIPKGLWTLETIEFADGDWIVKNNHHFRYQHRFHIITIQLIQDGNIELEIWAGCKKKRILKLIFSLGSDIKSLI